uniref:Uncharacterized protein n=1 Tax=Pseudomonas phage HRDY3 TaxID=3236930 RepID=A0AB39CDD3_9VIRU
MKKVEPHFVVMVMHMDQNENLINEEIGCTLEAQDAAGKDLLDPLPDVLRRAADVLEERLANGELSARRIIGVSAVMRVE